MQQLLLLLLPPPTSVRLRPQEQCLRHLYHPALARRRPEQQSESLVLILVVVVVRGEMRVAAQKITAKEQVQHSSAVVVEGGVATQKVIATKEVPRISSAGLRPPALPLV